MDNESGESMESLTFRCLCPARGPVRKNNLNAVGNDFNFDFNYNLRPSRHNLVLSQKAHQ